MASFAPDVRRTRREMSLKATDSRPLGRTKLRVTGLGFGGAPLGNLFSELAETDATDAVTTAHRAGINFFDTAPLYGHGLSEHRIGAALRLVPRDRYVLATKIGRLLRPQPEADGGLYRNILPFATAYDYSYDGVMRSVEDSLQRLGLARIDRAAHPRCRYLDAWQRGRHGGALCRGDARRLPRPHTPAGTRRRSARSVSASTNGRPVSASPRPAISTAFCWPAATRCSSRRRSGASCRSARGGGSR